MKTRAETKAETREALVAAALAEFTERGIDAPSLDAICARAGYTRGAFYVHFRDRDDLLVAVMESVIGRWLDTIVGTTDPGHDLLRTVERFSAVFGEVRAATGTTERAPLRLHLLLEACGRSPVVRERFVALIGEARARVAAIARAGQDAGVLRRDVAPEQAAALLTALVLGLLACVQTGVPIEASALRGAVLQLMVPSPA